MTPDRRRAFADGVFVENARYVRNDEIVLIIRNEDVNNFSYVRTSDQICGYICNDHLCFLRSGLEVGIVGKQTHDVDKSIEIFVDILKFPGLKRPGNISIRQLKTFDRVTVIGIQQTSLFIEDEDGCRGYIQSEYALQSAFVQSDSDVLALGKIKNIDVHGAESEKNCLKNKELVAVSQIFEKSAHILSLSGARGIIDLSLLRCDRSLTAHRVPRNWDRMPHATDILTFEVAQSSVEFHEIAGMILGGTVPANSPPQLAVTRLLRVQNKALWSRFLDTRERMEKQSSAGPNEKLLFHGTSAAKAEGIRDAGFLRSFSASNVFGQGAYFSLHASYSLQELYSPTDKAGQKCLIVARVLVGDSCLGLPGDVVPSKVRPGRKGRTDLCDSTVDDERQPAIFVTYAPGQEYPEYVAFLKVRRGGVDPGEPAPARSSWACSGWKLAAG